MGDIKGNCKYTSAMNTIVLLFSKQNKYYFTMICISILFQSHNLHCSFGLSNSDSKVVQNSLSRGKVWLHSFSVYLYGQIFQCCSKCHCQHPTALLWREVAQFGGGVTPVMRGCLIMWSWCGHDVETELWRWQVESKHKVECLYLLSYAVILWLS